MNLFDDDDYNEGWISDNPVINNFSKNQYNYAIEMINLSETNKNEINNIINLFKNLIDNQSNEGKNVVLFNIVRVVTKFYINLKHNDFVNLFEGNKKFGIINHRSFYNFIMKNKKTLSEKYHDEIYLDVLAEELTNDFLAQESTDDFFDDFIDDYNRLNIQKKSIRSLDAYKNATKAQATPVEVRPTEPATPAVAAAADGKRRKSKRKHSKKHSDGKRRKSRNKHSKKHSDGKSRKSKRKHSNKHSKKHSDGKRRKSKRKVRN